MRWLLLVFVTVFLVSSVTAVPHEQYSSFSSLEDRFSLVYGIFSDAVVYSTAYYSVGGADWQPLSVSGSPYEGSASWMADNVSFVYPPALSTLGEHYILFYSCSSSDAGAWDCHGNDANPSGFWQLVVIDNVVSDCTDVLDYQCGSRDICDTVKTYGFCQDGYDCSDNLCIAQDDLSCTGVSCADDEYCSNGACLLEVSGETRFVATWGDDNNLGTFEEPFYSWQRVVEASQPGDIAYIRGGVWMPEKHVLTSGGAETSRVAMDFHLGGVSGTVDNPIRYFAYPGERPIMDGRLLVPVIGGWNTGMGIIEVEHIHFKGLTIRHIHQRLPNFVSEFNRVYSEAYGIDCSHCANVHFENMVVHDVDGRGYNHWSGGSSEADEMHLPFRQDNSSWINCDVYNVFDRYDNTPGNAADAWLVGGNYPNHYYFEGCRAWNYSDDGYNLWGQAYNHFRDSWAIPTHKYLGLDDAWEVEGNGWKLSGRDSSKILDYEFGGEPYVIVENSISANCIGGGFINNIEVARTTDLPNNGIFRNNLGYLCDGNFWDPGVEEGVRSTTFTNNIAYASTDCPSYEDTCYRVGECDPGQQLCYEVGMYRPSIYSHSHNTWIGSMEQEGWPGWLYNPDYHVTDDDFVSLDWTQLWSPRKADGSLPDIEFGHLKEGSELIDGGTVIDGYHCSSAGAHPGDCVEWYGTAPDLGPFESSYTTQSSGTCDDGVLNQNELHVDCGGSCSACVLDGDFYVAPYGDDTNPGTIDFPWKTWGKAFNDELVNPGDLVYFRGGVYYRNVTPEKVLNPSWFHPDGTGYRIINDGLPGVISSFFAYPGETPILDDSNVLASDFTGSGTIHTMINGDCDYCHFKGLTVRNAWSINPGVEVVLWRGSGSHTLIENCVAYNGHGIGFQPWGNKINLTYLNCDAYNLSDDMALPPQLPGNRGTGFGMVNSVDGSFESTIYYIGCRAWDCGDQGFSAHSLGYVEYDSCWSFHNGKLQGGGHGFKIGQLYEDDQIMQLYPNRVVKNSIAAENRAIGLTTNEGGTHPAWSVDIYNNFFYHQWDFSDDYPNWSNGLEIYGTTSTDEVELLRVFKNNIAYDNFNVDVYTSASAVYTHDHNSWDGGVTVTDDDFVSLDWTQLLRPRKPDGSLPDITFGHLRADSDLIDAGVNVGLDYQGDYPDIGAFEFQG